MKLTKLMLTLTLAVMGSVQAKETVSYAEKAKWQPSKDLIQTKEGLVLKGRTFVLGKPFNIDPAKKYTISYTVFVKNLPANEKLSMNVGFFVYDANNRAIFCQNSCVVPKSFAKTLANAKKGDKVLLVDKAVKINARPWHNLVINAKEDLSDLPNRNIIASNIKSIIQKEKGWEITFATPLSKAVPAGTFIRFQSTGGYLGTGGNGVKVTAEPASISGSIQGFAPNGVWTKSKWPVGTAKASVFIQPSSKAKDFEIHFKNFSVDIE